jgi:DNA-binding transcriptional LysR family regulator
VARGGSTLSAAKALGVNQTTVARRLEALETALGLRLVERGQAGSRLTEAGAELMAQAEAVEQAVKTFTDKAQARQRGLAGRIKITCSEILANMVVTRAIAHFRRHYPEVQVDLMVGDEFLDVAAGEADVAIRSARSLPASDLVARKIADFEFALYASRDYVARMGRPASLPDLKDHDLINCDTPMGMLPGVQWMLDQAGGKPAAHTCNSMSNLGHAVSAGLGIAPLGCLWADADPNLVRLSDPIADSAASSWIVVRRDMKDTPRIRTFLDFLVPFLQAELKGLEAAVQRRREGVAAG